LRLDGKEWKKRKEVSFCLSQIILLHLSLFSKDIQDMAMQQHEEEAEKGYDKI